MQTGKACKETVVILFHLFSKSIDALRNIFIEDFIDRTYQKLLIQIPIVLHDCD